MISGILLILILEPDCEILTFMFACGGPKVEPSASWTSERLVGVAARATAAGVAWMAGAVEGAVWRMQGGQVLASSRYVYICIYIYIHMCMYVHIYIHRYTCAQRIYIMYTHNVDVHTRYSKSYRRLYGSSLPSVSTSGAGSSGDCIEREHDRPIS